MYSLGQGIDRRGKSWDAGVVVFLLYYTSFIFYFDVVVRLCCFGHMGSLWQEGHTERRRITRTISHGHKSHLTGARGHVCQRDAQYCSTHTYIHSKYLYLKVTILLRTLNPAKSSTLVLNENVLSIKLESVHFVKASKVKMMGRACHAKHHSLKNTIEWWRSTHHRLWLEIRTKARERQKNALKYS